MRKRDIRKELTEIYGIEDVLKPELDVPQAAGTNPDKDGTEVLQGWDALRSTLLSCELCRLAETRNSVVFGEGDEKACLMFIGEGPGADEDATGRPFVGRAGKLLTKMIEAMGYKREEVYIANVVKCRPPGNREPFKDEVDSCIGYLHKQIQLINPKVIVCLGATAAGHILNPGKKISGIRGQFKDFNGIKVMPTYHPAYLLRNESKKRDVWNDLKLVMQELGK